ncbi:unnamed protein product [Blepharisma stoltei]|uniref:TmcB/TmcC TPR repeats domain-containing protein n=1 Tax=Blepharisma stoltei TaxID=1481888 RepID=A0AAU9JSR7_9CILI|nr:unnamed protein product [Blepharisma stoltei]
MFRLEADIDESFSYKKEIWKIEKENSLINSVFELYRRLHFERNFGEKSISKQKFGAIVEATVWCVQIVSLLWTPKMSITGWSDNIIVWEVIGYLRLDHTCSALGIMNECLYFSILMSFINFLGITALVFIIYRSYTFPNILFSMFKRILYIWTTLLMVPSMALFSIFLKYSFLSENKVSEYKTNNDASKFQEAIVVQIGIIIGLIVSFFLLLFYSEFSGEIRHFASSKNIKAKAHSKIVTHSNIITYSLPIIYAVLSENYIIYFQLLTMIFSLLLMAETMVFIPYFSPFCNTIAIIKFFDVALISFIFLFGYIIDKGLSITLLAIALVPLSAVFIIQFSSKLQRKIPSGIPTSTIHINNEYNLEILLRKALYYNDEENKDQIIGIFETFFIEKSSQGSKYQVIWATNYCIFALKDESLAKVKLSKIKLICDWGLEANYQVYLCKKNIQKSSSSESSQFLNNFQQLNKIKRVDRQLCMNLLDFWKEITASRPSLKSLIKFLDQVDDGITVLNQEYSQLTTKYFNSRESLSLYASFARNILYDSEKSILLENKLRYFDRILQNSSNGSKNFSFFNDSNGVMIISNEEENFGEILFANSKVSEVLKCPSHFIVGNSLTYFIPNHYKDILIEEMRRIIRFDSASEIDLLEGLFWNLPTNFLVECTGKASLTSFNNFRVTLWVFKPKKAKHQAALISESGEILRHTINFSKIAKQVNGNLIGYNLENLFPSFKMYDLQSCTPYQLLYFENETILVKQYMEFRKIKIPYIILINEPQEILKWKADTCRIPRADEMEIQIAHQISLNMLRSLSSDGNKPLLYKDSQDYADSKANLNQTGLEDTLEVTESIHYSEKAEEEEKSQVSQPSSQKNFLKMMATSSQSINILHCVFIISILIVLATNVAVLFYAYANVDVASNVDLPLAVGTVGKDLQICAFFARALLALSYSTSSGASDFIIATYETFNRTVNELETIYGNIMSNLKDWDSCSGKSIFTDENTHIWGVDNGFYKKNTNLLNMVSQFIQNSNELLRKFAVSEDYSQELLFLIMNGYGESLRYCNQSLIDVIDCQRSGVSDFKTLMTGLLVLGIFILIACIAFMAPFCYSVIKVENKLWNNIRQHAHDHYFELIQGCFERLTRVHAQPEVMLTEKTLSKKQFNSKNYWKYGWRICVYLLAVSAFSLLNITYLYETCTDYLSYRPKVISELIQTQILAINLAIWTTEVLVEDSNQSLKALLVDVIPFSDTTKMMRKAVLRLVESENILRERHYSTIYSEKFIEMLYEKISGTDDLEFVYGIHTATQIAIMDASNVATSVNSMQEWVMLIYVLSDLNYYGGKLIEEVDSSSTKIIDAQMRIIVAVLVLFIAISVFMYFVFYMTFFRKEKRYLKKINSIMKIMP